jgi:methanogenic corrinoid protein MtbC1
MADTIKAALDLLIPEIRTLTEATGQKGTVVIGTVEGDIHEFGKELVAAVFQSAGYHVIDLGRDVPMERFISAAEKEKADIIAISALMTPALRNVEKLVSEIKTRKLKVKTIIGGLATSQDFAKRIRADAWAEDALEGLHALPSLTKVKDL